MGSSVLEKGRSAAMKGILLTLQCVSLPYRKWLQVSEWPRFTIPLNRGSSQLYCQQNRNKSAQSNLGRVGPRRGAVAQVPRKVPIGYIGAPQTLPVDRSPNPTTCLIPGPVRHDNAKRHPDPIRRFSTMHWMDRQTDRHIVHAKVWRL